MKRKYSIFIFGVFALAFVVLLVQTGGRGSFGKGNTSFAIPSGEEITTIEMIQAKEKIVLTLNDNLWTVNEAGEARKSAVNFLIQTLKGIEIKSPVSEDLFRGEIVEKGVAPVIVKVWSGKRVVKKIMVYKTDSNEYGNIMKLGERKKPFIVSIPGYQGSIGSNFNMNELFWVPFNIFNFAPNEIASVEVNYSATPDESFLIYNFSVSVADELKKAAIEQFDSAKVKRYLSYYTWVPFETWAFESGQAESDSIIAGMPLATIRLTLVNGDTERLDLWERTIMKGATRVVDTDRAWGRKDDSNNLFVVRYYDIDPLLRRKSYFSE
jgi:hypothetical protein